MTKREELATRRVKRIAKQWFAEFRLKRTKAGDRVFTMTMPDCGKDGKGIEFKFISKGGKMEFLLQPTKGSYCGAILNILAQTATILDGLLNSYYI